MSKSNFFKSDTLCKRDLVLPIDIYEAIKALATIRQLPVGHLICQAIENELNRPDSFNLDLSLPDVDADSIATKDSQNLFSFIRRHSGLNLTYLIMMRRQIGIDSKHDLLAAYALLLANGIVEEYYPNSPVFNYHKDYRVIRVPKANSKISGHVPNLKKIKSTIKTSVLDDID